MCKTDVTKPIDIHENNSHVLYFPKKAKLFKLSKIIDIEYQKKEIENLGRFIEVMKYEPIEWRTTHPYVLVDRLVRATNIHI